MLSLVLPLYNEEACVQDTVTGLLGALQGAGCELILVNNGSDDQTPYRINQLAIEHKKVKAYLWPTTPATAEASSLVCAKPKARWWAGAGGTARSPPSTCAAA